MWKGSVSNRRQSWWGPRWSRDDVINYMCPTNLTADSTFNTSSHCPVNSFGDPLDITVDSTMTFASSQYTRVD